MNNLEKLINDAKEEFNEAWHEPDIIYHDKKEKSPSFMKKIKNFIGLTR